MPTAVFGIPLAPRTGTNQVWDGRTFVTPATAANGTNTSQIATTAFVQSAFTLFKGTVNIWSGAQSFGLVSTSSTVTMTRASGGQNTLSMAINTDNVVRLQCTAVGDMKWSDGTNPAEVTVGRNLATGGLNVGAADTEKVGFWGVTPIVQPSGATQAAPAAYATGAFGLDSNAHMQALYDLVVAMRTALVNAGIMKGSA